MSSGPQIVVSDEIAAGVDRVWGFVGDFAGIMRWHPQVLACDVQGVGPGLVRKVHFADWWISERLDRWDAVATALAYTVVDSSRPGVAGASVSVTLSALSLQGTRLLWQASLPAGTTVAECETMAGYYRLRVAHLRHALGLTDRSTS